MNAKDRLSILERLSKATTEIMRNPGGISLQRRLTLITKLTTELLNAEASQILLVKRRGFLSLEASSGHRKGKFKKGKEFEVRTGRKTGLTGHVAAEGKVFKAHGSDLVKHPAVRGVKSEHLPSGACVSLLAMPLKKKTERGERLIGLLRAENKQGPDGRPSPRLGFDDQDESILNIFAEAITVAIENAELADQQKVQNEMLERLFTSSPDGIIAADDKGFVIHYNQRAEQILGYTARETINRKFHVSKFYADPREPGLIRRRINARKGATVSRHKTRLVGRDGEVIPVSLSATWLLDSKGARIGSVGYFEDLRSAEEKDKHLELLLKASNTFSRSKTVDEGLRRLVKLLVSHIPCGFCRILLFDESRQNLVPKAAYPEPGGRLKWDPGLDEPLDISRWPELSDWLKEGRPRLVSSRDPRYRLRLANISRRMGLGGEVESMLLVPLKVEGEAVGVLDLGELRGSEGGAFTDKRMRLVRAIAAQTAVLIHRVRLFEDAERHNRLLTAMDEALQHIRAEKEPPKLLQEFVRLAAELVGCRAGGLFIREPHQARPLLAVTYRMARKLRGSRLASADGFVAQVLQTGEALLLDGDARRQKREPVLSALDFKRVIAVPLPKTGGVEAVLLVGDESGRAGLTYESVDVLKRFVARSSVALHTAELMSSEQRMFDQLRILHKISDYIQAADKLDDILFVVVTGVTAGYGLGFNRAALLLLDERGEWLEGRMGIGHHTEEEARRAWDDTHRQGLYELDRLLDAVRQRQVPPTPLARLIPPLRIPVLGRRQRPDPLSQAVLKGTPARVPPPRLRRLPKEFLDAFRPTTEVVLIPLLSGEKTIGLLVADNKFTLAPITPEDISALGMFASTAAIAIDNIQWIQQTEAAAERLRSSFGASAALTSDKDPNDVLNDIVERIRVDANATWVSMVLIDETGHARKSYPSSPKGNPDIADIMRDGGNSMRVMRTGKPRAIEDVSDPRHGFNSAMLDHGGIASALCLPVSLHDVRIGVMWMHYAERRRFPPSDIEAWQLYVNHAAIAYDNARRMDTLRRMRKADEDFARAADTRALRQQIVDSARDVMQAEAAILWSYDSARGVFVTGDSVASGIPDELWARFKGHGPHPRGTTYEVLARGLIEVGDTHGRQVHIGPTTRRLLAKLGVGRFIGIAVSQGRERLGVLFVDYKRPRKFGKGRGFSREERETARAFANHAGMALKRARLVDDLNLAHQTARVVAEVTALGELDDTLRSIVKGTRKALGCDSVTLYEFDPVKKRLRPQPVMENVDDERGAYQLPEVQPDSIVARVLRRREMLIIKDTTTHPLLKNSRFARRERVATCVGIPLIAERSKVGVMFVNYSAPHQFTPLERENVKLFASQAAVAIGNAQLYEREQRRTRALKALYRAGHKVTGSLDEGKILRRITEQAWRISFSQGKPANFADIRMVRGDKLALEAIYPPKMIDTARGEIGAEINLAEGAVGIIGRAVLDARRDPDFGSKFVPDVGKDSDYIPFHDETRSELVVPIRIGREVIGAINVEHPELDAFDKIDRRTFESLAAQASVAIQNGRHYAGLEAKTELALMGIPNAAWSHDCRRYARHIYDSAKEAREELRRGDAGDQLKVDSDLKAVRRLARKIMKGPLTPGGSDPIDICQLIDWQLSDLKRRAPPDRPFTCQLTPPPRQQRVLVKGSRDTLAQALKYLYENSVEAMADSARRELRVNVKVSDQWVEIFVADTGKGIPRGILKKLFRQPIRKGKGAKGLGFGLLQAQTIIQAHQGDIRPGPTGPKGTTMHVWLPLLSEPKAAS
ncbi:MAG TPA: GAF domain-containing protein [Pyrinomonadaceae bacterium]|jgi:PAS domain S-box-containing protein|nr:GAF domain-containing protein [Pyrinomonadaceae bacterium]